MLQDVHGRTLDYLRLAVTDRCNLRCNYCMPVEGIAFSKKEELLSIDELTWLVKVMAKQGIRKVRITGGEPFARKNLMSLLENLSKIEALEDVSITTNATLIAPHIEALKNLGIKNINVSLDAIDRIRFARITRRNLYDVVYKNLFALLRNGFRVRVNFIVLEHQNIEDILPVLQLTERFDISVRFLEEMPFNGGERTFGKIHWNYKRIMSYIRNAHPEFEKIYSPPNSTSVNYRIPGYKGSFGVIPSFSRTFCGSCNRLRVSAKGDLITCLYADPILNLRDLIRTDPSAFDVSSFIAMAVATKAKDGFAAEASATNLYTTSMTSIGG